jgi:SAM-dependent methyltransferase
VDNKNEIFNVIDRKSERVSELGVLDEVTDERGITLRRVHVEDPSEYSSTREVRQAMITEWDNELQMHPDWLPPIDAENGDIIANNPVSHHIYDSPGMREWRRTLVPSAVALIPMQDPYLTHLPHRLEKVAEGEFVVVGGGEAVDDAARSFFMDALDSIGIRTRAKIMADTARQYVDDTQGTLWVSLACGAAMPVLDALKSINQEETTTKLHLIDIDEGTLESARQLAEGNGLVQGEDFITYPRNLLKDMIASDRLVAELGEESATMVDALGIFEYFSDTRSVQFLQNAYRLVKPGGALVIANMLSNRPELDFNQRGIGWPKIYPRALDEIIAIAGEAGVPLDKVTITVPQDGVYAVLELKK